MRLTTVRLFVDDVEGCATFYKDAFGFEERVNAGVYVALTAGGCEIGFYKKDLMAEVLGHPLEGSGPETFLLNIEVDSVDGERARLGAMGVVFETEPHDRPEWVMRVAHLRDPAGNLIELFESTYQGGSQGTDL
ncbi:MAG: lactoylglutathione lyase [Actinomycetota bacterium]|nr:lactoylglutathione lyase [Actinomycetota bacterium]